MPPPVLVAKNVRKVFPSPIRKTALTSVLNGISLTVSPKEFVAIVGPSGSGKSTLLHCLSGLEQHTSGSIEIMGNSLSGMKASALARVRRNHVGFIFQSYNLIPSLSAYDNVALPARLARRDANRQAVRQALHSVGLQDRAGHRPGKLSGGEQQRVAIARVLAMQPDLVFADEPTGALDTVRGAEVLRLLRAAASESAVVMVTHDLDAAATADRVLVLEDGTVRAELCTPSATEVFDAVHRASSVKEQV